MQIDTMRRIDYFVGIPLCFGLTLLSKLVEFFRPKADSLVQDFDCAPKIKKILFIELSEMGSAILADPALRWSEAQGAKNYFLIFKRNSGSLKLLGTIPKDQTIFIREENFFVFTLDTIKFILWARKQEFDAVVDLELFSRFTALLTGLCGAREKVGFYSFHNEGLYRGELLTRRVAYNPHIHISKNFMALVKSLFEKTKDLPFYKGEIRDEEVRLAKVPLATNEERERIWKVLEEVEPAARQTRWMIFNCAGGEFLPQRRWPQKYYIELAQKILDQHPQVRILLTGSPEEAQEVDSIRFKSNRGGIFNLCGKFAFQDLPILYQICSLMLSNDSGPAHFASITELPIFVFFGPETPALYGALGHFHPLYANLACSPCVSAWNHRKTPCRDNICLQVITPDQVYEKIKPYLS